MKSTWARIPRLAIGAAAALSLGLAGIPADAQDAGAALYKSKCAACHGADGKGETAIGKADKIRDLGSADVQQQSDADLTAIIAAGKGKMPAYGKSLKPEQVKDLVAYVRTLAKK
jgi:cytochrome c6